MLALYRCSEGVYYRETLAIAVAGFVEIARHAQSFSDVDVEHEYQVLHTHSSTQSCGSQPAAKAWFFFLDGVKFTCFGYQDYIQGTSAPHSYEGEYFMEVNDATQGAILARHHYLGSMAYSRTGAVDGTGWSITNFDSTRIDYPASGHGDTVAPRDWWHACFNQICSS